METSTLFRLAVCYSSPCSGDAHTLDRSLDDLVAHKRADNNLHCRALYCTREVQRVLHQLVTAIFDQLHANRFCQNPFSSSFWSHSLFEVAKICIFAANGEQKRQVATPCPPLMQSARKQKIKIYPRVSLRLRQLAGIYLDFLIFATIAKSPAWPARRMCLCLCGEIEKICR